jgi:hypothetical protein
MKIASRSNNGKYFLNRRAFFLFKPNTYIWHTYGIGVYAKYPGQIQNGGYMSM